MYAVSILEHGNITPIMLCAGELSARFGSSRRYFSSLERSKLGRERRRLKLVYIKSNLSYIF